MKQLFILLISSIMLFVSSCQSSKPEQGSNDYYTCPMHRTVKSKSPGACPVCGMDLIKIEQQKNDSNQLKGNFLILDERQQSLAGILMDTLRLIPLMPKSTILGTVVLDEDLASTISSRVKGRIDKLFIRSAGEYIQKGNPVYSIYSEQLLADEKEYLTLLAEKSRISKSSAILENMLSASKNKLKLWGLGDKEISALENSKKVNPLITFYAETAGYVQEVVIKEGMYVQEGSPIVKLTKLHQVWVEAQIYSDEEQSLDGVSNFQLYSETAPKNILKGYLVYKNPSMEQGRKVQLLRIRVDNSNHKLIPGMMLYVLPQIPIKTVLAIPKSAVLLEKMKTVWVKIDEYTFEQRMVETGIENKQYIEILSGLKAGELVVTSGAYLLSSEFILQHGTGQMHQH